MFLPINEQSLPLVLYVNLIFLV